MYPQQIPPEQPISVQMTAQEWNTSLMLMNEGLRALSRLLTEIQAQCLAANVREPASDVG